MILVDTSVWIDHLRADDPGLRELLEAGDVVVHPFVVGEIALGALRRRGAVLANLKDLPRSVVAEDDEVMALIERESLFGHGIGWVDAHLLAAARLTAETLLWTRDVRLAAVARRLSLGWQLPN